MTARHTSRAACLIAASALAVAVLAAAGCAGSENRYVGFRLVGVSLAAVPAGVKEGQPAPAAVQAEAPAIGVMIGGHGTIMKGKQGAEHEAFHVHMVLTNTRDKPLVVDPAKAWLVDDTGRTMVTGAAAYSGNHVLKTIEVQPGAAAAFSLAFTLPEAEKLQDIGSLRLMWPYEYGGKALTGSAKFVRTTHIAYHGPSPYGPPGTKVPPYYDWAARPGPLPYDYGYGYGPDLPYLIAPGLGFGRGYGGYGEIYEGYRGR